MAQIDEFSYQCGFIDCLNDIVSSGVKAMAFSHPLASAEAEGSLLPYVRRSCGAFGTKFYIEGAPLVTDLFPLSASRGVQLLFYREDHILGQYLRLKERRDALCREGAYFGGNRTQIAWELGRLLSLSEEAIRLRIRENREKEP